MKIRADYYQQFDADNTLDVPGEAYGGWKSATIEISREHTAVVIMHAWDAGTAERFPGWWRAVEYLPRAERICREVFPPLLEAVRESKFKLFHVVSPGRYYRHLPGALRALDLARPEAEPLEPIPSDPTLDRLRRFRAENVFVGKHNEEDVSAGFERLDFAHQAHPRDNEPVCETTRQLAAVCRAESVNHLVYAGFAINWCLLLSPGGMAEISKYGIMCSTIREAVTAVENKETARAETCKQIALWRVALAYGFVLGVEDFVESLRLKD